MKITIISDTHGYHRRLNLEGGDMLIHCGDISNIGQRNEVEDFIDWLQNQPYNNKIFCAGNHDKSFSPEFNSDQSKPIWLKFALQNLNFGTIYLENSEVIINGFKIWGSPYSPWFHGQYWAFNKQRGEEMKQVWDQIPMDINILLTHGPAFGILDYVPRNGDCAGCEDLRNKIIDIKPLIHVCGHIHPGYGHHFNGKTHFINASVLNDDYILINKPITLDLNEETKEITFV